ncbi:MAG: DNA-processing protein DprA [Anaerolineales bacterium]|nr:DNA-processing protein DprA [Anaerolineales bacterium]
MEENIKYWVGFNIVKGIGPVRLQSLMDVFGDIRTAWEAAPSQLRGAGLSEKLSLRVRDVRQGVDLDQLMSRIQREGITILTWRQDGYPDSLRDIPQSPPVLYTKGEWKERDRRAVAVVGTRRYTSYGRQAAEELTRALAHQGITVVSGLARGIDGIAHRTALDSGGRTIAVLGSGVDRIYPPEHRTLAKEIESQGLVLSDYPLGTPPEGQNFPPRNRIISGLARAVVVIEAGGRSGALITAKYAADQGREVFAVPGSIFSPACKGTNALIKQGAHPLLQSRDVMDVMEFSQIPESETVQSELPSNPTEAKLFQVLGLEPLHVDDICNRVEMPVEKVTSTLAVMEVKGLVRKTGAMQYMAVGESDVTYDVEG